MQRTSNYQLPTWEKSDRIMMEDFNGMTEKIDAGMERAQSTADTALAHKNYAIGYYTGMGSSQSIEVGFHPAAILISRRFEPGNQLTTAMTPIFINGLQYSVIEFTDSGFDLSQQLDNAWTIPSVNHRDQLYSYIAFR